MGDMKRWRVEVSYGVSLIWHSMTAMLLSAQGVVIDVRRQRIGLYPDLTRGAPAAVTPPAGR